MTLRCGLEQEVKKNPGSTGTGRMTSSTNLGSGVLGAGTVGRLTSWQRHVLRMRRSLGSLVDVVMIVRRTRVCTLDARWSGYVVGPAHDVCASACVNVGNL